MSRIAHCNGCAAEKNGIKSRMPIPHTCGREQDIINAITSQHFNRKKSINLKEVKFWTEKEGKRVLTSMRVYIGQVEIGRLHLLNKNEDRYWFHPLINCVQQEDGTLEELKYKIELSLKEFISKLTK